MDCFIDTIFAYHNPNAHLLPAELFILFGVPFKLLDWWVEVIYLMALAQKVLAQSPEPETHDKVLDNNPDWIGIWKC